MKAFLTITFFAVAAAAMTGCSTCYTEGYQSTYDSQGFRSDGAVGGRQISIYHFDDLYFHPTDQSADPIAPTFPFDPAFPSAPATEQQ